MLFDQRHHAGRTARNAVVSEGYGRTRQRRMNRSQVLTVILPVELVVRRGFSEDGSSAFDLGHDLVDGLGPHEGLGVVVPV